MDWSTIWTQILAWCAVIGGSISIPAIIGWIVNSYNRKRLQGFIAKTSIENKALVEEASEKAVKKAVGELKTVTFKHDIEPIVADNLKDGINKLNAETCKKLDKVSEQNKHVVELIDAFSQYFDGSYYIEDSKVEKFKQALETAKADYFEPKTAETVVSIEEHQEVANKGEKAQNESQNNIKVER